MLKPKKKTFNFSLTIVVQLFAYSIAKKSLINDDDYISRVNSDVDTNNKELYIPEAIRRGIERMIIESPYHRSKAQREAVIRRIGELLFHPPTKNESISNARSLQSSAKKDMVDYTFELEKGKNYKLVKTKMESYAKKDNLSGNANRNIESVGNKMASEVDKDIEASSVQRKMVGLPEQGNHSEKIKLQKGNVSVQNKREGAFLTGRPFEGYMKKLAQDVNGVMADATYMLRDTGKLIHGLKRVVKGASTLSSITNHAVKYAKLFAAEPENVTVDFLEEKAIIALLDAQKAANESRKAANLARIASVKAVDVEKRVETMEPDLQDVKLVKPYIEATEILADKAEKAAKLAKIEKEKTEKDFLTMNQDIKRMNIKATPETLQNSSVHPDKAYFYQKQKALEKELLLENKDVVGTKKTVRPNHIAEIKPHPREFKNITAPSKIVSSLRKDGGDITKEAISSIAAELTNNLIRSTSDSLSLAPTKKDIVRSPVKKHNIDPRKESITHTDGERITTENVGRTEQTPLLWQIANGNIMDPVVTGTKKEPIPLLNLNEENGEKTETEQSFGAILRNSIANRNKISSYLSNQFSPKVGLTETSLPELKVNKEENAKTVEPTPVNARHRSNGVSEEGLAKSETLHDLLTKRRKPSIDEEVEDGIVKLGKEEKNLILDYLDQDDSGSGDVSSDPERTLYKDYMSQDTTTIGKDKFHTENGVDRSKIPRKHPARRPLARRYHAPLNGTSTKNHFISLKPKPSALDRNTAKEIHIKSTIADAYENVNPFEFDRVDGSRKGFNRGLGFIPYSGNYLKRSSVTI